MNKNIANEFSNQIEKLKLKKHFDTYYETIEYALEENIYDELPVNYSNIKKFLNKSIKDKMLIEFSERGFIKNKYKKLKNETYF